MVSSGQILAVVLASVVIIVVPGPSVLFIVDRAAGAVPMQMLILAVCPVAVGLVTDTCWGLLAGQSRAWLSRTPRRLRTLGRIGGVSMIGLGLSVAVTGRHD